MKTLLIFDFDKTILDEDSYGHIILKTLTKEEIQTIYNNRKNNWVDGYNYTLKQLKSHNISKTDFDNLLNEISFSPGFQDLFNYIKSQKEKYDSIVLSSNYEYVIKHILNKNNLNNIFSDIICNPSREANENEKDQFIYVMKKKPHECKVCNPCACKYNEYKEFCESHDIKNYERIIFICDGFNDLCLAVNLKKNDVAFVRKNFSLHKKLIEDNLIDKLECKVEIWENGNDIVSYLEKI